MGSKILIFSGTAGYRHDSIEHGAEVITGLAAQEGCSTDHTEDPAVFSDDGLRRYAVTVWLSTSGDVLDDAQRAAYARWLAAGGGYAGVHSATTSEPGWPEYERIAGARFADHPEIQPAILHVTAADHPSTRGLPRSWQHVDEWYNFRRPPHDGCTVLLTVDEGTYSGGTMGPHHPVAWYGTYHAGAAWYTALGHSVQSYDDPLMRQHLLGGLRSLLAHRA